MKLSNTKKSSKKSLRSATLTSPSSLPVSAPALTSDEVAQCNALLTDLAGILGPVPQLSADDIRRLLKLRKGGAQVVTALVALCEHHGVTSVGPLRVATMSAEMDRANTLGQVGVQLAAVQKQLSDATLSAESAAWQYATALYTVLQRLSGMEPTLAAGLQPIQDFFQTKRTKGTQRDSANKRKVAAGQKAAAKLAASSQQTAAPAASIDSAGTSASAAPSGSTGNGSAPVAAPSLITNGAAHS